MYVLIVKKDTEAYSILYHHLVQSRAHVLNILAHKALKADNDKTLVFDVASCSNLFTPKLFLTFYKYIYLQEHILHPTIYPVGIINVDRDLCCCFCNLLQCCRKAYDEHKLTYMLKRFLSDQHDTPSVNMQTYSTQNCIVYTNKFGCVLTEESDLQTLNVTERNTNCLFVCVNKLVDNFCVFAVHDNFNSALFSSILRIIRRHQFYIMYECVHFLSDFYIFEVNFLDSINVGVACA